METQEGKENKRLANRNDLVGDGGGIVQAEDKLKLNKVVRKGEDEREL